MTSPARASTWIVRMPAFAARHAGEAEMCRWTAARWRNRPRLESMPDEEQCAHTKRVTRPSASARPGAPADSETGTGGMTANARAGSKSVQTMDIIAYRATCVGFVGLHERLHGLYSDVHCTWQHLPGTAQVRVLKLKVTRFKATPATIAAATLLDGERCCRSC